jgi:cytidylate kinase
MNDSYSEYSNLKGKIIAIDGPAGSGKSTTAKMLAARLGFSYLDTGAMYRAITYYALSNEILPSNGEKLAELAHKLHIEFETHSDINHVFIDGKEVTKEIRTPEVTLHVSEVSAHKNVRKAMVEKQKEMGKNGSIVAEGRDTTTVVFPDAEVKIYLNASVNERAKRRVKDLHQAGSDTDVEEQRKDIERRDNFDSNREHSPLTQAENAIVVDTTDLTIDGQVNKIIELIEDSLRK